MFRCSPHPGVWRRGRANTPEEASSRSSGSGQDKPAFSARSRFLNGRFSANTAALCRRLPPRRPLCQQRQQDLRNLFLIDNLVFAIVQLLAVLAEATTALKCDFIQRVFQALRGVAGFIIIGGRFGSYWVAGFNHIQWPGWVGLRN